MTRLALALLLALTLTRPVRAAQIPVTGSGSINSGSGTVCFDLVGNTSARVSVTGTFVAWYKFSGFGLPGCAGTGSGLHGLTDYYLDTVGVSNQVGSFVLQPMDGIQSVQVSIYGVSPPYGYTSGTINLAFSATSAVATPPNREAVHYRGVEMSTRPACSYPASPCSAPAVSPSAGADAVLTMHNTISHNIYLTGLIVRALDASATTTITITDGSDGEAVNFGRFTISTTESWVRFASPIYVAAGGNNLIVTATGSSGARLQINAVGVRK